MPRRNPEWCASARVSPGNNPRLNTCIQVKDVARRVPARTGTAARANPRANPPERGGDRRTGSHQPQRRAVFPRFSRSRRPLAQRPGRRGLDARARAAKFQLIAESQFASCAYHENERQRRDIHRVLGEDVKNRRPFIVGARRPDVAPSPSAGPADEEIMNTTPYPMFFVPVFVGEEQGHIGAILHVWLRAAGDPKTYPTLVDVPRPRSACHAGNFLKARQGEAAMARNQEYEHMLRFEGDFVGELDPLKLGRTAVNHFTDLFAGEPLQPVPSDGGAVAAGVRVQPGNDRPAQRTGRAPLQRWPRGCPSPTRRRPSRSTCPSRRPSGASRWRKSARGRSRTRSSKPHPHEGQTGLIMLERHAADAPFTPGRLAPARLGAARSFRPRHRWPRRPTARCLSAACCTR